MDKIDVVVTGGRDYDDFAMVQDTLSLFNIKKIIQGGANGADQLAREYAEFNGIECITVEADWNRHGRAAGPIRNKEMLLAYPNSILIAFPGGKGTENCVKQAVSMNRVVLTVHK